MSARPAIDYTNKDFASLKRGMLELARYRLPEWTDQSPADFGMLMVDLVAYMGDVVLYYLDRTASELFLPTAVERRNVLNLLRLIGYELKPAVAASADLALTFKAPPAGQERVTITGGTQFSTKGGPAETFEYLGPDLEIDLASSRVVRMADGKRVYSGLSVRHSQLAPPQVLGSSTGEPGQRFRLQGRPLIPDSLVVEVDEGAGPRRWERWDNLLHQTDANGHVQLAGAESRIHAVEYDEEGFAWVTFGDGVYGRIPPSGANNLRARLRVGGGLVGNVAAGAITEAKPKPDLLDSVTNPAPAAGGSDPESIEHAARFGPIAFRSAYRAVTLSDAVALVHLAGGVAKVRARSRGWNQIDLVVAPEGDRCRPAPADLKRRLVAFFEDKRMVGTFIHIEDPVCVPVEVSVEVEVEHNFTPDLVRSDVEKSVRSLLAFEVVDFGRPLYLSKIYEAVEALPGVHAATVTRFRRRDRDPGSGDGVAGALRGQMVGITGRIEIEEFELPFLAEVRVLTREVLV